MLDASTSEKKYKIDEDNFICVQALRDVLERDVKKIVGQFVELASELLLQLNKNSECSAP